MANSSFHLLSSENMPTKSPTSPAKKAIKVALKKLTSGELKAAERAAQKAIQARVEAQEDAAQAEFFKTLPLVWMTLLSKALRIKAIAGSYPEVVAEYEWWFEDFQVNPRTQSISYHGNLSVWTQDSMNAVTAQRMGSDFDMALLWFDEHDACVALERAEAIVKDGLRKSALSKLTEEDKKALGIFR